MGGRAPWDKAPGAAQRISASHLAVLEQAAVTAQAAEENERGIAYAAAARHISPERYSKFRRRLDLKVRKPRRTRRSAAG